MTTTTMPRCFLGRLAFILQEYGHSIEPVAGTSAEQIAATRARFDRALAFPPRTLGESERGQDTAACTEAGSKTND